MLRIGIVANEVSGDLLGTGLIKAIRERHPEAQFIGVGGQGMTAAGCESLVPMDRLSVMGLVEVLMHLPDLLAIRRLLERHFVADPPDVFVGIDAPDFNLGLEKRLRDAGIRTVHFVSPTVWAWRPKRVRTIAQAADLLLSIFPFETEFLGKQGIPVRYVGHPLADEIPRVVDRTAARTRLGFPSDARIIALLPGSRLSEIRYLTPVFLQAAAQCQKRVPGVRFAVPLVNRRIRDYVERVLDDFPTPISVTLVDGNSRDVIASADVVLTASGTATLETLLLKRPMVVAYRLHWLTYWIVKTFRLVKVPFIAMANLIAGAPLAPEFIQEACRPEALCESLVSFLEDPERVRSIEKRYEEIHETLRRDASRQAAQAVLEIAGRA